MAQETGGGQVPKVGRRDAVDRSHTQQHARLFSNCHAPPPPSKEALELSKLSAERDKVELELAQLRQGALDVTEVRRKIEHENEKNDLELQKLRKDVGTARWSQYFEFAKAFVPAGTIIASVWVAADSLNYQRDKDRSVDVSQQLLHFQNLITATAAQNQTTAPDLFKQHNAIAGIRILRKDAIPSLLANLDLEHGEAVLRALHEAILELNEDPALRESILAQLTSSIRYTALRPDLPHLDRYIALWRDCFGQYKKNDPKLFRQAASLGTRLIADLKSEIPAKNWDEKTSNLVTTAINKLQSQQ